MSAEREKEIREIADWPSVRIQPEVHGAFIDLLEKVMFLTSALASIAAQDSGEVGKYAKQVLIDAAATPSDEQKRQSDEVHEAYLGTDAPRTLHEALRLALKTAEVLVYYCGHPRGGCPNHCDPLVKVIDASRAALAAATPKDAIRAATPASTPREDK